MSKHWYVAHTRPRQETIAELNLQRQGFQCYLPRLSVRRRVRGHWQSLLEPLFPGYLFVQLDLECGHVAPIASTRGLRALVRFGTQYLPFADDAVTWLRQQELQQQARATERELFSPGEALTLLEGPFAGLKAVYQCSRSQDRVELLIQILGAQHTLVVPQDQVRRYG